MGSGLNLLSVLRNSRTTRTDITASQVPFHIDPEGMRKEVFCYRSRRKQTSNPTPPLGCRTSRETQLVLVSTLRQGRSQEKQNLIVMLLHKACRNDSEETSAETLRREA